MSDEPMGTTFDTISKRLFQETGWSSHTLLNKDGLHYDFDDSPGWEGSSLIRCSSEPALGYWSVGNTDEYALGKEEGAQAKKAEDETAGAWFAKAADAAAESKFPEPEEATKDQTAASALQAATLEVAAKLAEEATVAKNKEIKEKDKAQLKMKMNVRQGILTSVGSFVPQNFQEEAQNEPLEMKAGDSTDQRQSYMTDYELISLPVSDIRATHDSISDVFGPGPHVGKPLSSLIDDLRSNRVDPSSGELQIEGAFYDGKFRSISNRRVHCLQEAFGKTSDKMVLVRAFQLVAGIKTKHGRDFLTKFRQSNTTRCNGEQLTVRNPAIMSPALAHSPASDVREPTSAKLGCWDASMPENGVSFLRIAWKNMNGSDGTFATKTFMISYDGQQAIPFMLNIEASGRSKFRDAGWKGKPTLKCLDPDLVQSTWRMDFAISVGPVTEDVPDMPQAVSLPHDFAKKNNCGLPPNKQLFFGAYGSCEKASERSCYIFLYVRALWAFVDTT